MIKDSKQRLFEMMNRVGGMSPLNESEMIYEIDFQNLFDDLENKISCIDPEEFGEYLNFLVKRQKMPASKREPVPIKQPWVHASTIHKAGEPRLVKRRGPFGEEGTWEELKFRDVGSLNLSGEEYDEIIKVLGDFDIERFINEISQEPINIVDANDKMAKSFTEDSVTYNTGIPAFKGLIYNKDKNQFMYVTTCPGAGSCIKPCYARHGNYIKYPNPYLRATQILNYLLNEPELYRAKIYKELEDLCKQHGQDVTVYMRWNDSGDFFTHVYFDIAKSVTEELIKNGYNAKSYAYTKMANVYLQNTPYFQVTFSSNASPEQINILKDAGAWETAKTSNFLPKEYFHDLLIRKSKKTKEEIEAAKQAKMAEKQAKIDARNAKLAAKQAKMAAKNTSEEYSLNEDEETKLSEEYALNEEGKVMFIDGWAGVQELKRRIAEKAYPQYNMKPESILTYDEMMKTPPEEGVFWNVVVMPTGDGDIEARRPDVRKIFLSQH